MKFKDGKSVSQDFPDNDLKMTGNGKFLESLLKGKENNATITLDDAKTGKITERKYSELYSVEIVLAD